MEQSRQSGLAQPTMGETLAVVPPQMLSRRAAAAAAKLRKPAKLPPRPIVTVHRGASAKVGPIEPLRKPSSSKPIMKEVAVPQPSSLPQNDFVEIVADEPEQLVEFEATVQKTFAPEIEINTETADILADILASQRKTMIEKLKQMAAERQQVLFDGLWMPSSQAWSAYRRMQLMSWLSIGEGLLLVGGLAVSAGIFGVLLAAVAGLRP